MYLAVCTHLTGWGLQKSVFDQAAPSSGPNCESKPLLSLLNTFKKLIKNGQVVREKLI